MERFLDPVADKLMIAVALVLVVGEASIPYLAIPAAIIVGREIVISALREWMAEIGKRTSVAVSLIGKLKTLIQMAALILLLLYQPGSNQLLLTLGYWFIYIAAALTSLVDDNVSKSCMAGLDFTRRKVIMSNSNCGNSSVGRARPCQGRGREFESRFPLHKNIFKIIKLN